jgi:hypothetical protein
MIYQLLEPLLYGYGHSSDGNQRKRSDSRCEVETRVVIASYNDHCSAPFSRVGWHHQSLLGRGSRHCYGINFTNNRRPGMARPAGIQESSRFRLNIDL